ncbi:hypothetical protein PMAYCL1PPCAC_01506, partial [Pristionchus mayeri]
KEDTVHLKAEPLDELNNVNYEAPIFKDSKMVSKGEDDIVSDATMEMKEKPVEIKDEPIDEFSDIEQPMADETQIDDLKDVEVFTNSNGLNRIRYGADKEAKIPGSQSFRLFENAVKKEDMEGEVPDKRVTARR